MNIRIICVGKLREKYINQAVQEYQKRLKRYCRIEIIEVADERAPETLSSAEEIAVKAKEGERIVKVLGRDAFVIALVIEGQTFTSEEFAQKVQGLGLSGKSNMDFIIGGSLGLHSEILKKADLLLSFSTFTFPHQLMRVILLEQIYRAFRINRGEPYHK